MLFNLETSGLFQRLLICPARFRYIGELNGGGYYLNTGVGDYLVLTLGDTGWGTILC